METAQVLHVISPSIQSINNPRLLEHSQLTFHPWATIFGVHEEALSGIEKCEL